MHKGTHVHTDTCTHRHRHTYVHRHTQTHLFQLHIKHGYHLILLEQLTSASEYTGTSTDTSTQTRTHLYNGWFMNSCLFDSLHYIRSKVKVNEAWNRLHGRMLNNGDKQIGRLPNDIYSEAITICPVGLITIFSMPRTGSSC